jgi:heme-degrading monooxygenase HmoA
MIARIWHGFVPKEKAADYGNYLSDFGIRDYHSIPGNRAVHVLQRVEEDGVHFVLISYWESRESIEAYAGVDIEQAHYYPYDLECLVNPEPNVTHYDVLAAAENSGD